MDQHWRCENLRRWHSISGATKHYVWGFDGKRFDHVELQKELPLLENVNLVEIGSRFPYYGDHIQGIQNSGVTFQARASIQLSIFCKFLPFCSLLAFLSHFWSEIGSITNHQSLFIGFDRSSDRFLIGILFSLLFMIYIQL